MKKDEKTPCPICGYPLKFASYADDIQGQFITVETSARCTSCDYARGDAYGADYVKFGNLVVNWHHSDGDIILEKKQRQIAEAMRVAKPSYSHRRYKYYRITAGDDFIPF